MREFKNNFFQRVSALLVFYLSCCLAVTRLMSFFHIVNVRTELGCFSICLIFSQLRTSSEFPAISGFLVVHFRKDSTSFEKLQSCQSLSNLTKFARIAGNVSKVNLIYPFMSIKASALNFFCILSKENILKTMNNAFCFS